MLAVVDPIVRAHGAEVVDIELKSEVGWVLRVTVEKLGAESARLSTRDAAVDLELCSSVSRELSAALDVADLIPHRYSLEVGSPGIERPLRSEADYVRFAGERAKLKLRSGAVDGQKVVTGVLTGFAEGHVLLEEGASNHRVPLLDIVSARLVFEFGPPTKPGAGKKKRKS